MTQQEVAQKLNITQSTYSGYESSKYEPNIDILIAISKLFEVSIDNLVGNTNNFVIDLTDLTEIRKELLFDILSLDDFDCYERYRSMRDRKEWENEHPEEVEEFKRNLMEEREKEKEHFEWLIKNAESKK